MNSIKWMVFKMPEDLKAEFKIALIKNKLSVQNTFIAFVEALVGHSRGEKAQNTHIAAIIKRSQVLSKKE